MRPDRDSGATAQWSNVHQLREVQAPAGLRVERGSTCDTYTGSAQALVAAGLVRLDQLPGQPGRLKTSVRYDGNGEAIGARRRPALAGLTRITRTGRDCFHLVRYIGAAEAAQRREAEARESTETAARDSAARRAAAYATPAALREAMGEMLDAASRMLMNACGNGKAAPMPLRLSDSALSELSALLSRVRLVVENGAIVPNPEFEGQAAPKAPRARPALHVVRSDA